MIRTLAVIVFAVSAIGAAAQGTLQFKVEATGAGANPPNRSPNGATGSFYLNGNTFWGDVGFSDTSIIWEVFSLRDASGSALYSPDRIEWQDVGGPFGFGYAFWEPKTLTTIQPVNFWQASGISICATHNIQRVSTEEPSWLCPNLPLL